MVFASPVFLGCFLPLLLVVYFFANPKIRNSVLLAFSVVFYAWGEPRAVWVLLGLAVVNYPLSLLLGCLSKWRRVVLTVAIAINILALVYYKYAIFILENLSVVFGFCAKDLSLFQVQLPIGISFYVFQIVSYQIDVYRREVAPQKNILNLLLYVSLFPQLIAGPIVRYSTIASDFCKRDANIENICCGISRFIVGLAKKVFIADNMALIADQIFGQDPQGVSGLVCWIGTLAYSMQIFFDFSGYSDMAIGLGRVFNFRFLENFDFPYSSLSIQEFWRRWHMSLSTWLKDYLYIPLGGNRKGVLRTYVNLFVVFVICGLWHGAAWNFVVWGCYHGCGLVVERLGFIRVVSRMPLLVRNLYVLLFVCVGWVFFRAESLSHSCVFLRNMFVGNWRSASNGSAILLDCISVSNVLFLVVGGICSYPWVRCAWGRLNNNLQYVLLIGLFAVTMVFAMTSGYSPFIYFRF